MTEIEQDRNSIQTRLISVEIELDVIKTRFAGDFDKIFDESASPQVRRV
jgi:hypothetical protein